MEIKCNLILDSCCDLPHDVVDREGVYLVKFPYFDDDGEHLDDLSYPSGHSVRWSVCAWAATPGSNAIHKMILFFMLDPVPVFYV